MGPPPKAPGSPAHLTRTRDSHRTPVLAGRLSWQEEGLETGEEEEEQDQ